QRLVVVRAKGLLVRLDQSLVGRLEALQSLAHRVATGRIVDLAQRAGQEVYGIERVRDAGRRRDVLGTAGAKASLVGAEHALAGNRLLSQERVGLRRDYRRGRLQAARLRGLVGRHGRVGEDWSAGKLAAELRLGRQRLGDR